VDFLPGMYLAGFVTIVAPGVRRRRIVDLAARRAVALAAPVRHRALAVMPLVVVLLAAAGLFGYPAGWQQHSGAASTSVGGTYDPWSSAAGPGTPYDLTGFRVSRTVPGAVARATSAPSSSATSTTPSSGSTTHGSSLVSGSPGNGGLGAKVIPAPAGLTLSPDVHNGPISPADFNHYWGDPASLHFARGYDVTYGSNDASDSIEVALFQFATSADAAAFKADSVLGLPVKPKADPVIPGADDYDSTSPEQGTYIHGVIATKGNRAFAIEDINSSAAPVPLVERMAPAVRRAVRAGPCDRTVQC
jgi:hypothetical protein